MRDGDPDEGEGGPGVELDEARELDDVAGGGREARALGVVDEAGDGPVREGREGVEEAAGEAVDDAEVLEEEGAPEGVF